MPDVSYWVITEVNSCRTQRLYDYKLFRPGAMMDYILHKSMRIVREKKQELFRLVDLEEFSGETYQGIYFIKVYFIKVSAHKKI